MKKLYLILLIVLAKETGIAQFQYQGSYLNVSRPSGGAVVTGDILELRAVVSVPSGTSLTKLNYITSLPAGTSFISGSLKVVTNEGVVVAGANTGNYTDAPGDDAANINTGTGVISFFMGSGPTPTIGGSVNGGVTPPLFYNVASIYMAAYRVQVTAVTGSTITINGAFHYNTGSNITKNLPAYTIFVTPGVSCNTSSIINLFSTETNGTFGSGTTLNRSTASANVTGYSFVNLNSSSPVDGQYSVVNNTSGTGYSGASPAVSDKVFGVWDVVGDHTGSATGTGNPPAAPGSNKGYMLAVNASFAPAVVYNTTIGGLSTNTNYTMSFWIRNICPVCGNDPVSGTSSGGQGVKPNLSFDINGVNYFSTSEISYTGQWVKELFTFNSGAATSLTFTIRNNAPGGGGNDWVLDDLAITQCLLLLPVSVARFQGSLQPGATLLTWQSAGDGPGDAFYIERSTDGFHFLTIGRQPAGSQFNGSSYYFTDDHMPSAPTVYYRLRLEGKAGDNGYSNIIVVKPANSVVSAAFLAPNPARGYTYLYFKTAVAGGAQVRLLNTAGREVWSQPVQLAAGQNALELVLPATLPAGLYLVQINSGSATEYSRLIKE